MPFGPILLINIFVGEVILMVNLKAKPFNLSDEDKKYAFSGLALFRASAGGRRFAGAGRKRGVSTCYG